MQAAIAQKVDMYMFGKMELCIKKNTVRIEPRVIAAGSVDEPILTPQGKAEEEIASLTYELPDTLYVCTNGVTYRSMDDYELAQFADAVESYVSAAEQEPSYFRSYKWMRLNRHEEQEKVYYYNTDDDGDCDNQKEVLRERMDNDYTLLGHGHYSCVIECPWDDTKVIKLGHGPNMGDYYEDGWLSWAAFSMFMRKKGDYPMLPNIYSIMFRDNYYVALIERYDETYDHRGSIEWEYPAQEAILKASYNTLRSVIGRSYMDNPGVILNDQRANAQEWYDHPLRPGLGDTHGGNIMFDIKRNTVVLIDPCSNDYSLGTNKDEIFRKLGLKP